jgi:hypothetical protein
MERRTPSSRQSSAFAMLEAADGQSSGHPPRSAEPAPAHRSDPLVRGSAPAERPT